jgi:hypothetical protein
MTQKEIEQAFEDTYGHKPSSTELVSWKAYLWLIGAITKEEAE